jgi:hypothetical protein
MYTTDVEWEHGFGTGFGAGCIWAFFIAYLIRWFISCSFLADGDWRMG